ncbi:MAG TPA: response regulator [Polyangiaceae bacterium]|nr:response regulator [Polyangiaceae bacterium]
MVLASKSRARLSGARVLVVEDDGDTLEMLSEVLSLWGATVFEAASAADGMARFERERPDLVVSDLWMAGGDGYELIRGIRALPPERGGLTPAVAMSASENQRRALAAGFHAFLAKPFDVDRLVEVVADFLRPDEGAQAVAPWTIAVTRPGVLALTFAGRVGGADMRAMLDALLPHLERDVSELVVDLRKLAGFSPSVASIGQRAVWERRRRIRRLRIIGGSPLARLVVTSACQVLGIPVANEDPEPLGVHES